ncbi:MAG: hypothetical protein Kow00107_02020 [Planctomycetota bacterium]
MSRVLTLIITAFALCFASCAQLPHDSYEGRRYFLMGDYVRAAEVLERGAEEAGGNDLLLLMEAGYAWHCAREYARSCIALERADELAQIRSVVSLSEETASLVISDGFKPYRCPDYERALILILLAVNRFLLGEVENALVELRRLEEYIQSLENMGKDWLSLPAIHYLSGVCYFRAGEYDNARQEFSRAIALEPSVEVYHEALRLAETHFARDPSETDVGWLLCVSETGLAPIRVPAASFTAVPAFARRNSALSDAEVSAVVDGAIIPTVGRIDIERMAVEWLQSRAAYYLAKEVGSVAAREILADKIGDMTDSSDAEAAVRLALFLSRRPDLRSWQVLPQRITIAASPFHEYEGTVRFRVRGKCGEFSSESVHIRVKRGKITTVLHKALNF